MMKRALFAGAALVIGATFMQGVGIIFILPMAGDRLGIGLDIFKWAVWTPVAWLLPFFKAIAGIV